MTGPCARSLKLLRDEGYTVAVVERWNQFARVRQDLFGFIDILALRGDCLLAVQTTSGSNVAARIHKINETQAASLWLESQSRQIEVHGWRKVGPRGGRKTWQCRREKILRITANGNEFRFTGTP